MEFNFRGWDAQMEHMCHTPLKEGLWSETSQGGVSGSVDMREAIQRELEKERIREEILAEEIARRRLLEAEVRREMAMHDPSSFMLNPSLSHNNRLEPGLPRAQPFAPVSLEEKHGGSGRRRRCRSKRNTVGKPVGETLSGAKEKPPSPAAAGSSKWNCAVCKVSATCEHGFNEHLAGKKHQAQMATLKANKAQTHGAQQKTCKKQSLSPSISDDEMVKLKNKSAEIELGVAPEKPTTITMESEVLKSKKPVKTQPPLTKNSSKCISIDSKDDDKKSEGEGKRQELLFLCKMCNVGASSVKVMQVHIKGKKHLKNLAMKTKKA